VGIEIERKFLVLSADYRKDATVQFFRQGYLLNEREKVVRVRTCGGKAYLTVKGVTSNVTRTEFEYEIPETDANHMLDVFCRGAILEKNRHTLEVGGFRWEVDEFLGLNEGLVVAEIELRHESAEFPKPDWLGAEVSHDTRYYNSNLAVNPFQQWH
jgi:CYTH domain-containing protein